MAMDGIRLSADSFSPVMISSAPSARTGMGIYLSALSEPEGHRKRPCPLPVDAD